MTDIQRLLELALKGLEAERARIENEITEIRNQLNHRATVETVEVGMPRRRKRRKMSAAARKRISEGMKRRYAAMRQPGQNVQQGKQSQSGGLTATGRKKLSEMMKARWAAKKKAAAKK